MFVVPVFAPMFNVVASPPRLSIVALALNRLPVVWSVAIVPELALMSPVNVVAPVPRNEKVGLVVALPRATFSEPLVVLMLR